MTSCVAAPRPDESDVLLLEDEPAAAQELREHLGTNGAVHWTVVDSMDEVRDAVREKRFEAASIDWELEDGFGVGGEVLRMLRKEAPATATVVVTKHQRALQEAQFWGADSWLLKKRTAEPYRAAMSEALRLGHARQIASSLSEMGIGGIPDVMSIRRLEPEAEQQLCAMARRVAAERIANREDGHSLAQRLQRRGWWRHEQIDVIQYARLPASHKLRALVNATHLTPEDLQAILSAEYDAIQALMVAGVPPAMAGLEDTSPASQLLLAILSYVMTLADYNTEVMSELWRSKDHYRRSLVPPPWSRVGIHDYLKHGGAVALCACVEWIRSH